jgi:hypothetical protein
VRAGDLRYAGRLAGIDVYGFAAGVRPPTDEPAFPAAIRILDVICGLTWIRADAADRATIHKRHRWSFHLAKEHVMRSPFRILAGAFAALILFIQPGIGHAAEIKVLCAAGFRVAMNELAPNFERVSNNKLALSFATLEVAVKQIQGGETADVVVLPREAIDSLIKDGKARAGSVSPIARVGISVAVA